MIRCIRLFALAPHRARHVRRIVRHVRRAHRVYRAHIVSRVVCYAVAGGMAIGGGAMLVHPPFEGSPWPMVMPQPGPGAELLPPSAFVAPSGAPIVWPAVYGTPMPKTRIHCCPNGCHGPLRSDVELAPFGKIAATYLVCDKCGWFVDVAELSKSSRPDLLRMDRID